MRCLGSILLLLAACTQGTPAPDLTPSSSPIPLTQSSPPEPIRVGLAIGTLPAERTQSPYWETIQWAIDQVNARGGVGGRPFQLVNLSFGLREELSGIPSLLDADVEAVLVAGSPWLVTNHRSTIVAARMPVIAVGGDLYTGRLLYRYAFQTAIPLRWQARVIARYLVVDRGYIDIAVAAPSRGTAEAVAFALTEEGITASHTIGRFDSKRDGGLLPDLISRRVADQEAVAAVGELVSGAYSPVDLGEHLARLGSDARLAIAGDALHPHVTASSRLRPGAVLVAPYTWSAWASVIPRVQSFRERYQAEFGGLPTGPEQEAYDAVMTLAEALERTGGEGGDALVHALEGFRDETYSSTPVRLGPDDHVFAEESHLGLFTIEATGVEAPGETLGPVPWRPIMRTFTTDGEKVNFLDRDKPIFFPFWEKKRPTPKYWRSLYGIISRPSDPLH